MDSSGLCCHSFAAGRIICDTAYRGIRDIYAVDILNMRFNVTGGHAFGVHGQNLLLDVLADAGLIFPQHLGVKFALAIPRHRYLYIAKAGAQGFAAVPVPAVIRVLVLVVIPVVAQLIVQLGLQTVFHELRDSVLEQFLNVIHAAYIRQLQQLTNFFAMCVFFWSSFPS